MASKGIEIVSAAMVFKRVFWGIVIFVSSLLLLPNTEYENFRWVGVVIGMAFFVWGWRSVRDPKAALRYAFKPSAMVLDLIKEWEPTNYRLETDYEKSLHTLLKERLPFVKVSRQYGAARVKCDIAVGRDVMIELKVGFKTTQKLQRLIGQIELWKKEWEKPLIVVLLGETQEDLLHDLHKSIHRYQNVYVVTKEAKEIAEETQARALG